MAGKYIIISLSILILLAAGFLTLPALGPSKLAEKDFIENSEAATAIARFVADNVLARPVAEQPLDLTQYSDEEIKKMKFEVDQGLVVIDPWLNGFNYRKAITISSSSAQTNYQVRVSTDTSTLVSNSKL
jgi:hypothetical protein